MLGGKNGATPLRVMLRVVIKNFDCDFAVLVLCWRAGLTAFDTQITTYKKHKTGLLGFYGIHDRPSLRGTVTQLTVYLVNDVY